jgi:hypothetical protein
MLLLEQRAGIRLQLIPYAGGPAQAMNDVMSGRVPLVLDGYAGLALDRQAAFKLDEHVDCHCQVLRSVATVLICKPFAIVPAESDVGDLRPVFPAPPWGLFVPSGHP